MFTHWYAMQFGINLLNILGLFSWLTLNYCFLHLVQCSINKKYSCSKLVISVTEHLVEVVDKLSTTAVVFFIWLRL